MAFKEITDPAEVARLNAGAVPGTVPSGEDGGASLAGHAKSFGRGLADFGIGTVGGLGDIHKFSGDVAEGVGLERGTGHKIAGAFLGAMPGGGVLAEAAAPYAPNSETVRKKVEDTTGPLYEPKGAEKYTRAVGEFLPNLIGGGGAAAWLRRGAESLGGALGSEYAGQKAHEWGLPEIPSRMLGAFFGSAPAGRAASMWSNSIRRRAVPTNADLRQAADLGYDTARSLNPEYQPTLVHNLQREIAHDLVKDGFRGNADQTFRTVEELLGRPPQNISPRGPSQSINPTYEDIEGVRKALVRMARERAPGTGTRTENANAASQAIHKIDEFLENPTNATSGSAPIAAAAARFSAYGRGNWAALEHSRELDLARQKGEWGAAVSGSGANIDNRLRQQIRNILANPARANRYTPQQRAIMEDVVSGSNMRNSARLIGKMAVTGAIPGMAVMMLAKKMGLGLAGEIGLAGAGYLAKKSGDYWTRREINELSHVVRSESPLGTLRGIPDYATAMSRARATGVMTPLVATPSQEQQPQQQQP